MAYEHPNWLLSNCGSNGVEHLCWARWKARTDLIWLCRNVLDFKHVSRKLHGVFCSRLQQFPAPPTFREAMSLDRFDGEKWNYTPYIVDQERLPAKLPDVNKLPGKRKRLILDSRGFLKSTINMFAHTVQWHANYPDAAIILFQANDDKISEVLATLKNIYLVNAKFRELFPEYCPPSDIKNWGNMSRFTLPNRTAGHAFTMPSIQGLSLGASLAGKHVDVIKYSDVVDEKNSEKIEMVQKTISQFDMSDNLLIGPDYWQDVEGTRYHAEDLYGAIVQREKERQTRGIAFKYKGKYHFYREDAEKAAGPKNKSKIQIVENVYIPDLERRRWEVYINCCWERDYSKFDKPATFDYDDADAPFLVGEDGRYVSRWPERFSTEALLDKAERDYYQYTCQQLNNPRSNPDGSGPFPITQFHSLVRPKRVLREKIQLSHYQISWDTAVYSGNRHCYTAIICAGVDGSGRNWVVECHIGKYPPEEAVEIVFKMFKHYHSAYHPVSRILLEDVPYNRGLKTYITRTMQLRGVHLPIVDVPRDTNESKIARISGTLSPRYKAGDILFAVDDICDPDTEEIRQPNFDEWPDWLRHLYKEFDNFAEPNPLWFVDGMDALTDLFWGKEWHGRERARASAYQESQLPWPEKYFQSHPNETMPSSGNEQYYNITGGF